ncbi:helix-turn-helix domain-containing protein [Pediococcus claussenii]|uniref:Transcriptional regulator n=1 Tax=Pediococcus claussenii (strain ATCC BAA-344 / DSM 14800 / JCM 18046 / KCTC 3811 / LMG 21948 / P06) TaxID=701521 RepID=G8PCL3_PEDCP|nr:helix-turn-helix domain-containing protein [Pediococcus claussenii]AEV94998.1 Putative transcriptional regulator [Pediococcus claussenii ATCC BAA-344]ANZ70187.1 hypothetical protein AYR57_07580 [Pediococcus claussenii]ANZ72003.1 hypothetical protein AYR58_07580 [Pediococcus claussenii]KRN19200.1 hypothetical protein IV79_GL001572 [Pediococcus claussenii]
MMSSKKYKNIGQRLRTARQQKGWTINDVHLKLQISARYLMALEAGAEEDLPGDYYTQSIIKQYADLLGISSEQITKMSVPKSVENWREEHREVDSRSERDANKRPSVIKGLIHQFPKLMATVLTAIILLLAWGAVNGASGHQSPVYAYKDATVIDHTKKVKKSFVNGKQEKELTPTQKVTMVKGTDPDQITIKTGSLKKIDLKLTVGSAQSWIMLNQESGTPETLYQGTVAAGDKQNFVLSKGQSYGLQIGNNKSVRGEFTNQIKIPSEPSVASIRNIKIKVK